MSEQMMLLAMQLGFIIFAAFGGGVISRRLGFPSVLGELIAGMIIGPYMLGGIALPGFHEGLFPTEGSFPISEELYGFTSVASILLLFLVGLETNLKLFLRFAAAGTMVGMGGALVSFILGDLTAVYFYRHVLDVPLNFLSPIPLFLGVISSATSVGISARILSENNKVDTPEGVTILAGAVIDDILGVILLAIIIGISESGHVAWHEVTKVGLIAFTTWLGFTAVGLLLAHRISALLSRIKDAATLSIAGLGLALIGAGLFEHAGLAMIIGAYVVGLSLSQTSIGLVIENQLSPLYKFFVPVFFCVMGMLVDFRSFGQPHILLFGVIFTVVAVAAKLIGCSLPSLFLNFNLMGATRIGLGMLPRGEVALIIAGIGLSSGLLEADSFAVAMMMTVLSTLLTPTVLEWSLKLNRPSLRKDVATAGTKAISLTFPIPSPETTHLVRSQILSVLQAEGYFLLLLDMETRTYLVRKDDVSFQIQTTPDGIKFDFHSNECTIINSLIFEVFADLEKTMHDLQKSIPLELIRRRLIESDGQPNDIPTICKGLFTIHPEAVDVNLKGETKEAVLEEMLNLLIRSKSLPEEKRDEALQELKEREIHMSTGMQKGIALPHAKTAAVENLVCAAGLHKEGVDFDSLDGAKSHIFVMLLTPKNKPTDYLRMLATLGRLLSDETRRREILEAKNNEQLFKAMIG